MKSYSNTDAVNQFNEADLLVRMEWVNLNQAFDLRRHRWKDWV